MIKFDNLKNITRDQDIVLNGIKAEHELAKSDVCLAVDTFVLLTWSVFANPKYVNKKDKPIVNQVANLLLRKGYIVVSNSPLTDSKYSATDEYRKVSDASLTINESEAMSLLNANIRTLKSIAKKARTRYENGLAWSKNYVKDYEAIKAELLAREDVQNILKNN